ncbi:MAG: CBS domain-containing protein [Chloroflexi bacterium]|nr:CBS domain-containing protein [Chloroflexota bacterium]
MKISTVLATKGATVFTVRADATLSRAVTLLVEHNIGALVVMNEQARLTGIISERDVVRALAGGENALAQRVGDVMTAAVIVASPQDDLRSVMNTMTQKRIRHLPVLEQDQLVGIVSIGDMVKAQLDEYEGTIDTLQTQLTKG